MTFYVSAKSVLPPERGQAFVSTPLRENASWNIFKQRIQNEAISHPIDLKNIVFEVDQLRLTSLDKFKRVRDIVNSQGGSMPTRTVPISFDEYRIRLGRTAH